MNRLEKYLREDKKYNDYCKSYEVLYALKSEFIKALYLDKILIWLNNFLSKHNLFQKDKND